MKVTVNKPTELEVEAVRVSFQPRYDGDEGAMPRDFPLRDGAIWAGTIDLLSGYIREWPADKMGEYEIDEKVCDTGSYALIGPAGEVLAEKLQDYVPSIIPGDYGDYINLKIKDGRVSNWRGASEARLQEFFPTE